MKGRHVAPIETGCTFWVSQGEHFISLLYIKGLASAKKVIFSLHT